MNERTKIGLRILEAAVLLGVCGDVLLRATPLGLNVTLMTSALVVALFALARKGKSLLPDDARRWLLPAAIFFALCVAWRDSFVLKALDVAAIGVLFSLVLMETRGGRVRAAGIVRYLTALVGTAFTTWFGSVSLIFSDIKWREVKCDANSKWSRHLAACLRGLLIGVPLLLVFGLLFMAADAVFSQLVGNAFGFDAGRVFSHLLLILLFTWLAAGFLRAVFLGEHTSATKIDKSVAVTAESGAGAAESVLPAIASRARFKLGTIEIGVVFGMLNMLFLAFVLIQIRYLFGGAESVLTTANLTYAEYARRGFFELVWVAALVLGLLLIAHHLLRREDKLCARVFRSLAGSLIALVFIIMASALMRMKLYQSEYGLTELRIYTTAFMVWLAAMLACFVWMVLMRNLREKFAVGALASGLCVIAALHIVNPDALIVRANAAHITPARAFDVAYALDALSLDAAPELLRVMPRLASSEQQQIAAHLLERQERLQADDWRAWSVACNIAHRRIERQEPELRRLNLSRTTEATTNETER